jgi:hypothetical protein
MIQTADSFKPKAPNLLVVFLALLSAQPDHRTSILDTRPTAFRLSFFNTQFRKKLDQLKNVQKNIYN